MDDAANSSKAVCMATICPEVLHPGQTGCKLMELDVRLSKFDLALNGPEDKPELGLIHQCRVLYEREKRRWTRMQKLTLAAIVVPVLCTFLVWGSINAYTFIKDLSQASQELHQLHRTVTQEKKIVPPTIGELFTAHVTQLPQFAVK